MKQNKNKLRIPRYNFNTKNFNKVKTIQLKTFRFLQKFHVKMVFHRLLDLTNDFKIDISLMLNN